MTQTFTEDVRVDGSQDVVQLRVEGHSTQSAALQNWQNSAGSTLASMTGDGRLIIGDDLGAATPDSMIEVHRDSTSTTKPKRGIHSLGRIASPISDAVAWIVGELELIGADTISGLHTAIRGRIRHTNTGSSTGADVRAGDFEAANESGTSGSRVGQVTGIQAAVSNAANGYISTATGLRVNVANQNTTSGAISTAYGLRVDDLPSQATNRYAVHTGTGIARFGDALELQAPGSVASPPANAVRLYAKTGTDGKVYAKGNSGTEYDLTLGGVTTIRENAVNVVTGADMIDFKDLNVEDLGNGDAAVYLNLPGICEGRLTLQSNTPVPSADVLAATTLYFTPYKGNRISLFDGTRWKVHSFSQISIAIPSTTNKNYDVYAYFTGSAVALELTAWTDDDDRTPATALTLQDGVHVRSGATTRRLLGTIRTTSVSGQCEDSSQKRFVNNLCNAVPRKLKVVDTTNSWVSTQVGWRAWNNSSSNRVEVVVCRSENLIELAFVGAGQASASNAAFFGIGLDLMTNSAEIIGASSISGLFASPTLLKAQLNEGYHYLQLLEYLQSGTTTYFGDNNTSYFQTGATGTWWA